jgi:hypothetical protein
MKTMGLLLAGLAFFPADYALAHKFSTAYLDVSEVGGQPLIVWQVALHDLAQAQLLPGTTSNTLRWQQVLDSEATLATYISARMMFTADAAPCQLTPQPANSWVLQQKQGDYYLQLAIQADCRTPHAWQLQYRALFDIEHSHKALVSWHVGNDRLNAVVDAKTAVYPAN